MYGSWFLIDPLLCSTSLLRLGWFLVVTGQTEFGFNFFVKWAKIEMHVYFYVIMQGYLKWHFVCFCQNKSLWLWTRVAFCLIIHFSKPNKSKFSFLKDGKLNLSNIYLAHDQTKQHINPVCNLVSLGAIIFFSWSVFHAL